MIPCFHGFTCGHYSSVLMERNGHFSHTKRAQQWFIFFFLYSLPFFNVCGCQNILTVFFHATCELVIHIAGPFPSLHHSGTSYTSTYAALILSRASWEKWKVVENDLCFSAHDSARQRGHPASVGFPFQPPPLL